MTPQQAAAAADLQFFTGMCIFGILLGLLVALVVGFIGAKEHLAASERQAERQRRLDEQDRKLAELERCRKVTARRLSPREIEEWARTGVLRQVSLHGHHDDYDEPLQVRWLCPIHHTEWHEKNGPGANLEGAPVLLGRPARQRQQTGGNPAQNLSGGLK